MFKLNMKLVRRFVHLAKPYWYSKEKRSARILIALLFVVMLAETWFNVYFNEQSGEFTSALAAMDGPRYWRSIIRFCISLVVAVPVYAFYYYLRDKLGNKWRLWMTQDFLARYFDNRAFYQLLKSPEIDNPDQRIAEDVASFTRDSLSFFLIFAGAGFQLIAFSKVLWSISRSLVLFLVLYAAIGTLITFRVFGETLVTLYFNQRKREADFRFGLVRIRENAESIALYHGEGQEHAQVRRRFDAVYENFDKLIRWSLRISFFQYSYSFFALVLPSLILAPRVLSGELEVGRVIQAAGAFTAILGALTLLVDNLDGLSRFAAGVGRLESFGRFLATGHKKGGDAKERITTQKADLIRLDAVTVQTPNYERTLVKDLSFSVAAGESLLIVGPSGCGKSSLLRAIAGLWDAGTGTIERPASDDMLFVPQHAYMILGNLRSQLNYPNIEHSVSDAELIEALERVNLAGLVDRCGGFDNELDFEKTLSVGERQRLAFARVLLKQPKYALLDEATSALDPVNESALFKQLIGTATTVISVTHHSSLVKYHTQVLELMGTGEWRIHAAKGFKFTEELS